MFNKVKAYNFGPCQIFSLAFTQQMLLRVSARLIDVFRGQLTVVAHAVVAFLARCAQYMLASDTSLLRYSTSICIMALDVYIKRLPNGRLGEKEGGDA